MKGHGLKETQLALLIVQQAARYEAQHFVEQIDFVDVISLVARMLDEQHDELDESVQPLVARLTHALAEQQVARVDAQLGANAEEARDHVVGLEEALAVHLEHELLKGFRVLFVRQRRVMLEPVVEQLVALVLEAHRVVKVFGLLHACVHHGEGRCVDAVVGRRGRL